MKRRTLAILGAAGAALTLALVLSCQFLLQQQKAAEAAQRDLAEGVRMIEQIKVLSQRPTLAGEKERHDNETYGLIESTVKSAGVDAKVRRIASEKPRRLGDSAYKEQPTQVSLPPITLKQLVALGLDLSSPEVGLNLETIRLSAPRDADTGDLWNAEVVLTYLIYDPPQAGKQESPR